MRARQMKEEVFFHKKVAVLSWERKLLMNVLTYIRIHGMKTCQHQTGLVEVVEVSSVVAVAVQECPGNKWI